MGMNRLEVLLSMVDQNPADGFSRYGLAMEYVRSGDLETAMDQFVKLLEHNPNYAAAYFHGGQTLEKLGRIDEAKGLYRRGIEVTGEMGDDHTRSELQAALSMLG
jgi:Tfp pilus assembly protein PilF